MMNNILIMIESAEMLFGNVVETFEKSNGWRCYTFGNANRRGERVQIWHDTQTGEVDIYIGLNTAWYQQYKLQANNAHATSTHTPHAKGTELMWHLGSVAEAYNMFTAWAARYGVVVESKPTTKSKAKSAKTA